MALHQHNENKAAPIAMCVLIALAIILPFLGKHLLHTTPPIKTTSLPLSKSNQSHWLTIKSKQGDTLESILNKMEVAEDTLSHVLKQTAHAKAFKKISTNQQIQVQLDEKKQLLQLVLPLSTQKQLTFERQQNGHFQSTIETITSKTHLHYLSATINHSLYTTAKRVHLPTKLLNQLTQMFSHQINFSKDIRKGDKFTVIYPIIYSQDGKSRIGDIKAASFTNKNKTLYLVRSTAKNHGNEFYTLEGKSLRLGFDRYPVNYSRIASRFSLHRVHPILGISRAHKGIDLAAPMGTPIKAVADGVIARIGKNGGYGNMIKIMHSAKYETVYAHMLRFKKGLRKFASVKRGDIIGYVGQSGLATGPHCHFEFHIYKRSVNPAKVNLPRSPSLSRRELAQFKPRAKALIAQLKLYQDSKFAQANRL